MATGHDAGIVPSAGAFVTVPTLTAEQFFAYPSEGRRLELVAGEIREMSPSGFDHGEVALQLGFLLKDYAQSHDIGRFSSNDTGFVVARNPDTVLAPDIAFVRHDRIGAASCPGFVEGVPDLAVEVVSPWDRPSEVEAKARHWIGCGVRLVWVVHGGKKTVTVYRAGGERRTIALDGSLDGEDVLPGFTTTLRRIFQC